jgi:hypothetical protein
VEEGKESRGVKNAYYTIMVDYSKKLWVGWGSNSWR